MRFASVGAPGLLAALILVSPRPADAQAGAPIPSPRDTMPQARRVDGRVELGTRAGGTGLSNLWVVLHRVGPDRAGPLDSTRTRRDGRYHLSYETSGSPDAVYFVSATYDGIAYFTPPLRGPAVNGDDATIVVFDTAAAPGALHIGGRHVIIGSAQPDGRRPVGEVYDLENDSTITVVAHDSTPVFVGHLPAGAVNFRLNENGDIAPGAITQKGNDIGLFAPISPGVRQLAFTYELPADAFPLSVPVERPTTVLEVLVQETGARVQAPGVRELAPVTTEGRTFRRFMAQDLAANAVLRVDEPDVHSGSTARIIAVVSSVLAALMIAAGVIALRRRVPRVSRVSRVSRGTAAPSPARAEPESERLVRALAELDAEHERTGNGGGPESDYGARRAALKQRLIEALAAERQRA